MTTKITFIFRNPVDAEQFELEYQAGLLDLVRALPGVRQVGAARVWPKEDGSAAPAHRIVDASFADYASAVEATRSPAAGNLFPAVFRLGTGGVDILFTDVEEDGA